LAHVQEVIDFMENHVTDYGIEPMCKVLRIAPSTWYARKAHKVDPEKRSKRAKADDAMRLKIRQVLRIISASMACAKSGINSNAKAKISVVMLWHAS
jgi:hypothetical protein